MSEMFEKYVIRCMVVHVRFRLRFQRPVNSRMIFLLVTSSSNRSPLSISLLIAGYDNYCLG